MEGLSLISGRFVTDKWKVCHYGGRLVIVIYFNVVFFNLKQYKSTACGVDKFVFIEIKVEDLSLVVFYSVDKLFV